MRFDRLKHLAIFALISEQGSFAAAARLLGTSRSRISEQITQLEEELGVRLFQRTTRRLSLTQEGENIFNIAKSLPNLLEEIVALASQEKPTGRVSITATNDIGITQLLSALQSFSIKYPDIETDIILSDEKLDLIDEGIDLGLRVSFPKDGRLTGKLLHQERFKIYASPSYLNTHQVPTTLSELENHHWIALAHASSNGYQNIFLKDQVIPLKPEKYSMCNSPLMVQRMVCAGMGIGLLLPATMKKEIEQEDIVPVMPELSGSHVVYTLVYPSKRQMPLRVKYLLDHLLNEKIF